ncbi:DUF2272 domain-containing protein [Azohydromonas lata]|uniref:DUF2272 domain-containing protein n=1 Tax=Azohydromonas lata TaxID=45677 RepID=UPI000836650C|nr:DUF2272 domain-containing protein [Azohydromonas lata]
MSTPALSFLACRLRRARRAAAGAAACIAALALGGCAGPREEADVPAALGLGGRVVTLPTPRQRLVHLALQEWALWGRARWDSAADTWDGPAGAGTPRREHMADAASRVLLYWQVLRGDTFVAEGAQYPDGSLVAWSAVFISYLMKSAGVPDAVFPASALHWHYIKAVHDGPSPAGFEALDAARTPPAVGDLICAPREGTAQRVTRFEQLAGDAGAGGWHCDLVVEVGPAALGAIGGNVRNTVAWSRVPLSADGLLRPSPQRPWLVVLRNHLP